MFFFFFQAEDGIRDLTVTGVQTCALPIYRERKLDRHRSVHGAELELRGVALRDRQVHRPVGRLGVEPRSEERRVGKSVDLGGRRIIKKKKKKNKREEEI